MDDNPSKSQTKMQIANVSSASIESPRERALMLELVDLCLEHTDKVHSIVLLYQIVLARRPDIAGLMQHVSSMSSGMSLFDLAKIFIHAAEALPIWSGPDWLAHAQRNAGVALDPSIDLSPADYCFALASDVAVRRRFPLVERVFPEGLSMAYPPAYRLWRSEDLVNAQAASTGESLALFVVLTHIDSVALPGDLDEIQRAWPAAEIVLLVPPDLRDSFEALAAQSSFIASFVWAPSGSEAQARLFETVEREFAIFMHESDRLGASLDAALQSNAADFDIVLFDEEYLDPAEAFARPRFGAGWDRHSLLCEPLRHLIVVRTTMLARAGPKLPDDPELAEWSLALRLADFVDRDRIGHIPTVGRSRRPRLCGPTLGDGALELVLSAAHERGVPVVSVAHADNRSVRVQLSRENSPRVSALVLTSDQPALLRRCMEGLLRRTDYSALEIVLVDNGSVDPDALALLSNYRADPRVVLVEAPGPFNWGRFTNMAAAHATGEILLLLNNDVDVLHSDWLSEIVGHVQQRDVGVVGAKLIYPDGNIQHAGLALNAHGLPYHIWRDADGASPGYGNQLCTVRTVTAVTGGCLAVRRAVREEVGGIEDAYGSYFSDVDFCMKVADLGYDVLWTPYARLIHIEQATFGWTVAEADRQLFQQRWPSDKAIEVYANPNLVHGSSPRLAARPAREQLGRPARRPCGDWRM